MRAEPHEPQIDNFEITTEQFLELSPEQATRALAQNPNCFEFLKKETSARVIRKLTELIKYFVESGELQTAEKFTEIKKSIYENLESAGEPKWFEGFNEEEKKTMMDQAGSLELTTGCSKKCSFCGFNAKHGVRATMSFGDLVYVVRHHPTKLMTKEGEFYLYWASDPLDYQDGDKDYLDVVELFMFYIGTKPFGSTAYPAGKKELLKTLIEKGYLGRVSVSQENVDDLKRDGFLIEEPNGNFTSPYEDVLNGLSRNYKKEQEDEDEEPSKTKPEKKFYDVPKRDASAGRAYNKDKNDSQVGGIECQIGVILKCDGFYNHAICSPKKKRTGIVSQKIEPQNISKEIRKENLPKTIDEMMKYGIVENEDITGRTKIYSHLIMYNFFGGKKRKYFVEYDANTLEVLDLEEIGQEDEEEFQAFLETKKGWAYQKWEEEHSEFSRSSKSIMNLYRLSPEKYDLKTLKKTSPFYKKIIELTKDGVEEFITKPEEEWDTNKFSIHARCDLSESNEETEFDRNDIKEILTCFKNIFELARDCLEGITPEKLNEIEGRFMDKLFQSLFDGLMSATHTTSTQKRESTKFLRKLFNK